MSWVLTNAPVPYDGERLDEDDLGTIKIALSTCATDTEGFWERTHRGVGTQNIFDRALDRLMAMEEAAVPDDPPANSGLDLSVNLLGDPHVSWFTSFLNHFFLWLVLLITCLTGTYLAGPGHCKIARCICTHFVHYDADPGNCGYCRHSFLLHETE